MTGTAFGASYWRRPLSADGADAHSSTTADSRHQGAEATASAPASAVGPRRGRRSHRPEGAATVGLQQREASTAERSGRRRAFRAAGFGHAPRTGSRHELGPSSSGLVPVRRLPPACASDQKRRRPVAESGAHTRQWAPAARPRWPSRRGLAAAAGDNPTPPTRASGRRGTGAVAGGDAHRPQRKVPPGIGKEKQCARSGYRHLTAPAGRCDATTTHQRLMDCPSWQRPHAPVGPASLGLQQRSAASDPHTSGRRGPEDAAIIHAHLPQQPVRTRTSA